MESLDQVLEQIEDLLDNSMKIPFSNKIMVDKEEMLELITDIRLRLPNEIKQSKWVIEERNKILIEAQNEAEGKIKLTESKVNQLINEHEITKKAYEQSEEIIESAKKVSREMRLGAKEYADEILHNIQENIKNVMEQSHQGFEKIESLMYNQMQTLEENRKELNVRKNQNIKESSNE